MKAIRFTIPLIIVFIILSGYQHISKAQGISDKSVLAENDSIAVLCQVTDSAKDEYDISEVSIWIKNKNSGQESELYQTKRPDWHFWYMGDDVEFFPVSIDSILVNQLVHIYNDNPLQLIVEGVPDCRNVFSYFIDVPSRKAWYVPANAGYAGCTSEENYMIFRSYRYMSDPEIAGRYTFLQIFDNTGKMIDSLSMERHHLIDYLPEDATETEDITE